MDKFPLFLSFIFLCQLGISQKLVEKEIINPETQFVEINTLNCFQVTLDTEATQRLKVEASIEGEYIKDLAIKVEEEGANIIISADFLPSFLAPHYKFNVHKAISISLSVTLPEYMNAAIIGTNSNVYVTGNYKKLSVTLADGNCSFDNVSEYVSAKTQTGEIVVHNAMGTIVAESEYGKVQKGTIAKGDHYFELHSVEGNILIKNN